MSYNVVVGIYEKIGTNNCCGRRTDSHLICGGFHTRDEAMQYIDNNEINGYKYTYSMCRKTPSFSYGDIRHVHRIYASN